MLSKSAKKAAIVTLADMIHMRVIEFTPVNSGYRSLIMSYTDGLLDALEELVGEFGDDADQETFERVKELVVKAEADATVEVVGLGRSLTLS
jgi:hypothetical protein